MEGLWRHHHNDSCGMNNIFLIFFWLRLVMNDFSDVIDIPEIAVDRIVVCEQYFFVNHIGFVYDRAFYNDGAPTQNPNTSGMQIVVLERRDAIFADGFSACRRYEEGEWK